MNILLLYKRMPAKAKRINAVQAAERLQQIRKADVRRHKAVQDRQKLRREIRRAQVNNTLKMERDRLIHASVQGPLQQHAERRLARLKDIIVNVAKDPLLNSG